MEIIKMLLLLLMMMMMQESRREPGGGGGDGENCGCDSVRQHMCRQVLAVETTSSMTTAARRIETMEGGCR